MWCGRTRGRQARARRGPYKLCLKRMQKVLLPVCKIETGVCGLGSGLLPVCRCTGASSGMPPGSGEAGQGTVRDGGGGSPRAPSAARPHSPSYQIRKLLAAAAAAAKARVTGVRIEKGAEGPPPLLSSMGSQIFVVDGGTSELVVLVVVSGEHGGTQGRTGAGTPPDLGGHEEHCSCSLYQAGAASPSEGPCLLSPACPASAIRQILLPQGSEMTPLPSGLYPACPDIKDQEQQGPDKWECGSHSVETPGAEGPSPGRSCREQDKARQRRRLTQRTGGGDGLTWSLGLGGEVSWLLSPGGGVGRHAPVTPCPNIIVLGRHLDDVLLARVGVCDGVRGAVGQLHLQPDHGGGGPWESGE